MNTKFWSDALKGKDHSEDQGVDSMTMSESILEK